MRFAHKALAWVLFAVAFIAWGFICALLLALSLSWWTEARYTVFVLGIVLLTWTTREAYWWVKNGPWTLR